jgi:hypothetical protein
MKSKYTHLVFLNQKVDPEAWSLYVPFCTEIKTNETKRHAILGSDIGLFGASYIQVKAHFKDSVINIKLPNSAVLLIQEVASEEKKVVRGFAPKVSL